MGTAYYNRGVGAAAMWIEAMKNAQKMHNKVGKTINGPEFRDGYEALDMTDERLKELGIHGMLSPFKITCAVHDGAQRWRMMQWDGKKFEIVSDWNPATDSEVHPQADRGLGRAGTPRSTTCRFASASRDRHRVRSALLAR